MPWPWRETLKSLKVTSIPPSNPNDVDGTIVAEGITTNTLSVAGPLAVQGGADYNGPVRIATPTVWIDVTAPSVTVLGTTYTLGASPSASATVNGTAINNAITAANAAGGGVVYVPPGTYSVTTAGTHSIILKSNVILQGAGISNTVLKQVAAAPNFAYVIATTAAASDIAIRDMTIDGNGAGQSGNPGPGGGIVISGVVRFECRNVRVINAYVEAFVVSDSTGSGGGTASADGLLHNCYCSNSGVAVWRSAAAFQATSAQRITWVQCSTNGSSGNGFDLEPNNAADILEELTLINCTVVVATLNGFYLGKVQAGTNPRAVVLINPVALSVTGAGGNGMFLAAAQIKMFGGYFTGAAGNGLYIAPDTAQRCDGSEFHGVTSKSNTNSGLFLDGTGNVINDIHVIGGRFELNGAAGIRATGPTGLAIIGAQVLSNTTYGIQIVNNGGTNPFDCMVIGNTLFNAGTGTQTTDIYIPLGTGHVVFGNRAKDATPINFTGTGVVSMAGDLAGVNSLNLGNAGVIGSGNINGPTGWRLYSNGTQQLLINDFVNYVKFLTGLVVNKVTLTDAATVAVDGSAGNYQTLLVTAGVGATRAIGSPSNSITGMKLTFMVLQDGTGGRAVTWNAVFKTSWVDTGNTLNKRSSITYVYDGTNWNQEGAQTPYV